MPNEIDRRTKFDTHPLYRSRSILHELNSLKSSIRVSGLASPTVMRILLRFFGNIETVCII